MTGAQQNKLHVEVISDLEVKLTRVFDAPRELVFEAFTNKWHIERWWGLRRTSTRVDVLDLRVGGQWRFVELSEDGEEYAFRGEFREIVPPEKLAYSFEVEAEPGRIMGDAITFEDLGGRTKVTIIAYFESIEDRDRMIDAGMEYGAGESYDQLEELLEKLGSVTK